ncbi:hypothetical protein LINPERHAP1_LOCUS15994, partial [Linum perenne]
SLSGNQHNSVSAFCLFEALCFGFIPRASESDVGLITSTDFHISFDLELCVIFNSQANPFSLTNKVNQQWIPLFSNRNSLLT